MSEIVNPTPQDAATPKKKSKNLLVIGGFIILLLIGGGGFYFLGRSNAAAEPAAESKNEKARSKKDSGTEEEPKANDDDSLGNALPDDRSVKQVVELQPFIINLSDAESARYLRMTVSLGIGEEAGEKPDQLFLTRVKNAMLAVLTTKKSDEVLTVEGKAKLRKELLKAAQAASEEPHVEAIYITDFIVQL